LPKQVLVYMSKEDENEFLDFLRGSSKMIILPATSPTSDFPRLDSLPEASQSEATRKFWLMNMTVDLPLVLIFPEQAGYYLIDGFQSPVIEFLRSYKISGIMLPGRLQADMNYFDTNQQDLVPKPKEFRRWYESIETWIRREYKHITFQTYAGPGAQKFQNDGGILH
jgi:hypothetical protein